jgi:hypothetical protein
VSVRMTPLLGGATEGAGEGEVRRTQEPAALGGERLRAGIDAIVKCLSKGFKKAGRISSSYLNHLTSNTAHGVRIPSL